MGSWGRKNTAMTTITREDIWEKISGGTRLYPLPTLAQLQNVCKDVVVGMNFKCWPYRVDVRLITNLEQTCSDIEFKSMRSSYLKNYIIRQNRLS